MADFFQRDEGLASDERLRQLEKKLHWCMQMLFDAGLVQDRFGNDASVPSGDINDIFVDAMEVKQELSQ